MHITIIGEAILIEDNGRAIFIFEKDYDPLMTELESKAMELWPDKFKQTEYTLVQADDGATAMLTAEEAARLDAKIRERQIPQNSKGTK